MAPAVSKSDSSRVVWSSVSRVLRAGLEMFALA